MFLALAIALPIILSPVIYLAGRGWGKRAGWISFLILLFSTLMLLTPAMNSADYVEEYSWRPIGNFNLRLDGLSLPFAAIIYTLSTAIAVYSIPYMTHKIEEDLSGEANQAVFNRRMGLYFMLLQLYAAGMVGTVLATNLIQFYVFFELMLIPSFFLIATFGYGEKEKISMMYFLWTHVGALVLLAGILTLGFAGGTFDFAGITEANIAGSFRIWIAVAITVGLMVKLAAFGLHIWLPYAHAEAPTPISALLSPAMIGIGGYALIRLLAFILPSAFLTVTLATAIWGLITMVYGGMMAFKQDDLKRLLAYSSVSQMGYIIFGISAVSYLGMGGSVMQYVSHGTGKAILFLAAGSIILQTHGTRSIKQLGGLAGKLPLTATAALIGSLVIIGAPPLNGFQAEWILFYGAFTGAFMTESLIRQVLVVLALASTPVTAGYALWMIKRVFFGETPSHLESVVEAKAAITIPLLFLGFLSLLIGIYPGLLLDRLLPILELAIGR
jgi:NADH-quinone oxidoreductase subunit M